MNCSLYGSFERGYQDDRGFASAPTTLEFNSQQNPCPEQVNLDANAFDISVFLNDQFGNIVKGKYLVDYPTTVYLSYTSSSINLSVDSTAELIDDATGAATFTNIALCGPNNSTVKLHFDSSAKQYNLIGESCSILLVGCPSGFKPQESSPCDICVESESANVLLIIGILLCVICTLGTILCLIVSSFIVWRYIKKRNRRRMQSLEIPDFTGKPSLTIEDILNDANIPRLHWREITIEKTIGKGASGIVSKGVWNTSFVHVVPY